MLKSVSKDNFNLFYSPLRFQKGFILPEILVVVIIILLLTSVVMANHRENQKRITLQRATHKVAQDIRTAQEMAMSGRECPECGGGVPPGYGIFFDVSFPNQYILYADTQPAGGDTFYSGDTVIETINLEKGAVIQDINTFTQQVSINFKPPDPLIDIKFEAGNGNVNSAVITLAPESDSSLTKTITVNTVGLIDID